MRIRLAVTVVGLGGRVSVAPILAHRSVAAKYDIPTTITTEGVVTKTEWTNPHCSLLAREWGMPTNSQ